jgi:hypothetical protein
VFALWEKEMKGERGWLKSPERREAIEKWKENKPKHEQDIEGSFAWSQEYWDARLEYVKRIGGTHR